MESEVRVGGSVEDGGDGGLEAQAYATYERFGGAGGRGEYEVPWTGEEQGSSATGFQ